ncbi:TlyA family RNA methyltransferase [Hyphomicrobiales bacterium 4NK60-0047b]|jgi:23S rRNA (cytidine1920-2'-O)/16S rRNA (cytidine1409-2'-O)-methyltransferase
MSKSQPSNPKKVRLDLLMVEKKLVPTRSKARDLIKSGHVRVDGEVTKKAGQIWLETAEIKIAEEAPGFVSRAGIKLAHALEQFEMECKGKTILDLGASTGGFTEVLLGHEAAHVYAVDVGRDQLHKDLKEDERITSMEGRDARTLIKDEFKHPIDAITVDVSFISLMKLLEQPLTLVEPGGWVIALIKPQFEVGKKALGKKGIVKDKEAIQVVLDTVTSWFENQMSWHVIGLIPSPITGQTGNQEFLICVGRED